MEPTKMNVGKIEAPFARWTPEINEIGAKTPRALLGPGAIVRGLLGPGAQKMGNSRERLFPSGAEGLGEPKAG